MYSIFDEGLGRLMSAGRNSPTKEAAKEALLQLPLPAPAPETNSKHCPNCRPMNSQRVTTTKKYQAPHALRGRYRIYFALVPAHLPLRPV